MSLHTLMASVHLSASLCQTLLWSGRSTGIGQKLGLLWREEDASPFLWFRKWTRKPMPCNLPRKMGFWTPRGFQDYWLRPGYWRHPITGRELGGKEPMDR